MNFALLSPQLVTFPCDRSPPTRRCQVSFPVALSFDTNRPVTFAVHMKVTLLLACTSYLRERENLPVSPIATPLIFG